MGNFFGRGVFMATHNVSLKLPVVPIADEADAVFKIKIDGTILGALTVANESLVWRPAHTVGADALEVTWTEFDEWMRARETLRY
jgi:hypothetical protein